MDEFRFDKNSILFGGGDDNWIRFYIRKDDEIVLVDSALMDEEYSPELTLDNIDTLIEFLESAKAELEGGE